VSEWFVPRADAFFAADAAFGDVTGALPLLAKVVDVDAHEGPTYLPGEDALYVTTVPRGRPLRPPRAFVKRIALDGDVFGLAPDRVTAVSSDVVMPNGMTRDADGSLIVCDQGDWRHPARIARLEPRTGATTTITDDWHGLPLKSPNDVVVKSDGTIWFTDPSYGYLQGFRPEPQWRDTVYRYDPAHDDLVIVADHLDKPNGLVFSPDETVLYVGDSGANRQPGTFHPGRPHHVYAYDVLGGRSLSRERVVDVTEPGIPDGLAVDLTGRLYVSCAEGVRVLTPDGRLLGRIRLPGAVNLTFGGPEGNHLYITADTAVWVAVLDTKAA
jgi:gluconolactonase